MFRSLFAALIVVLGFGTGGICQVTTDPGTLQVINVNFISNSGPNPNVTADGTAFSSAFAPAFYEGDRWNDLAVTTGNGLGPASSDLLDSEGSTTGIGFSVRVNENADPAFNFSQTISDGNSDIFANFWAPSTSPTASLSNVIVGFTGLDDDLLYDFTFLAIGDVVGQGATANLFTGQSVSSSGAPSSDSTDAPLELGANFNLLTDLSSTDGNLTILFSPAPTGAPNIAALSGFQLSTTVAVPEPSSLTLMALGGLLLTASRRKKKIKSTRHRD